MGEANHAVALRLEGRVAGSIALESSTMAVEGEAVQLGYEAMLRPQRIYLEAEEEGVDGRGGQPVRATEGDEDVLKRGACAAAALLGDEPPDGGEPAASCAAVAGSLEGVTLQEAEAIRLLVGSPKPPLGAEFGNFQERSCHGGEGDPVAHDPLLRVDGGPVQTDAPPAWSTVGGGDVDRLRRIEQSPERGGAQVAENGALAMGQHRGEPDATLVQARMADCVHAAVYGVQAPGSQSGIDGASS